MSLFDLLYTVLIKPLQLVFEIIFIISNRIIGNPALAIIALSLAMNFLVLPLYRRADAMQEEARDMDKKLSRGIKHIKNSFSGDERMMVLQTYYRQNNYSPLSSLKGSVSLLLEIPFFIAAYQFLSHLNELQGVSFGPIADLGAPDALITIGNISINLLPFLMTGINLISSALFLKGFPLKSKIQLYGMAIFFLVFLYTSPAGLLFYWTLNNTFSLIKTIFYKIPNPKKVLSMLASFTGVAVAVVAVAFIGLAHKTLFLACLLLALTLQAPVLSKYLPKMQNTFTLSADKKFFTYCGCFITLLTGFLIPSAVIAASPTEFIQPGAYHNPLLYLLMAGLLSAGYFIVWLRIFYGLAGEKLKPVFEALLFALCLCMPANYMLFGTEFGNLSNTLIYTDVYTLDYSRSQIMLNLLLMAVIVLAAFLLVYKKRNFAKSMVLTLCIAVALMSAFNCVNISKSTSSSGLKEYSSGAETPEIPLSRDGKNVIVIMLDRAYSAYLPVILEEKPELKESFDGFTFYPNTTSFGNVTNYGAVAVFGGYEYTPVEMNKRSDELLVDKHNEACKLMPSLFYDEGYEVTVCDVSYANYRFNPDMSIYDEYEGMNAYNLDALLIDPDYFQSIVQANYRNFFCFSMVKCIPPAFQNLLYFQGNYNQAENEYASQTFGADFLSAKNLDVGFVIEHNVLDMLPELSVESDKENTFLLMCNEAPHTTPLLQMPDYRPQLVVDNSGFDINNPFYDIAIESGVNIPYSSYHANIASIMRLAEWFDYMREIGAYDNSRIIIVADHGNYWAKTDNLFESNGYKGRINAYNPLLLVKDFDSHGFSVNDEFMTNADTPTLALENIIENPVNPFTGKVVNNEEKFAHPQYITPMDVFGVESSHNLTCYADTDWISVSDNIFNPDNWTYYGSERSSLPPQ